MKRTELFVLIAIMAVTVGMRFIALDHTPPGLYPDEAMNGTNALEANRTGDYKLFYPENNGREGMFINLQALSIKVFGNTAFALRFVSAIMGSLTVLGLYLLARRMFDDWRIAALAAFLMAIGFWHVNFSRIGFRAIMAPLCAVWGFYYLYRGIETHRIWSWALAGFWWGLGFHTYIAFRILPVAVGCALIAYWIAIRHAFSHDKYHFARHQMLGGVAAMVGVMILVILPLAAYFYANPADFMGRTTQVAVWSGSNPVFELTKNTVLTLGMFFVYGDGNWRHNYAGAPVLYWPVAALFAAGLIRTIWRGYTTWKQRGHPGIPQVILLSWFAVGLAPSVLSNEGLPHALRAIIVAPPVYLMAALGLHWLIIWLSRWMEQRNTRQVCLPWFSHSGAHGKRLCTGESTLLIALAVGSLLLAISIHGVSRYFVAWGTHPAVAASFDQHTSDIAHRLLQLPPSTLKYVIVDRDGGLVNGIPMPAQPIMFLTDTWLPAQQREHNIFYLTPEQFRTQKLPQNTFIIKLSE